MKNRTCPQEELLSKYLSGVLPPEDRSDIEKHLADCAECRVLLVEAHDILSRRDVCEIIRNFLSFVLANRWLLGSAAALGLSFLLPGYFLQFLVVSIIAGAKWIIDAKTTKMLITIHEACKRGDRDKTTDSFSRFDK